MFLESIQKGTAKERYLEMIGNKNQFEVIRNLHITCVCTEGNPTEVLAIVIVKVLIEEFVQTLVHVIQIL